VKGLEKRPEGNVLEEGEGGVKKSWEEIIPSVFLSIHDNAIGHNRPRLVPRIYSTNDYA